MMDFLNTLAKIYQHIPPGAWQALLASGILSPAIHIWHRWHVTRKEKEIAEWAMIILVIIVAFVASALYYLWTKHPSYPTIIMLHTAVLGFTMTPFYIIVVKPLFNYLSKKSAESDAYNAEINDLKRAVIPADGLPISMDAPQPADANQKDGF